MNIPENDDNDYLDFLNTCNIYYLNQEEQKISKMNKTLGSYGSTENWSKSQKKEYYDLISYLNEKYPFDYDVYNCVDKNRTIRKEKCDKLKEQIRKENVRYQIHKNKYLQIIKERKEILINETKNKRKEKALEDIICECGLLSKRKNLAAHKTSKTHIKLMAVSKETPRCVEINSNIIKEKEEKEEIEFNKKFDKIMKEEEEEEEYEDIDPDYLITSKQFTDEQIKNFKRENKLPDDYLLIINKDLTYRKKWSIPDKSLRAICKKENGITVMPLVIIGIC
jgi:hypothetical protein